VKERITRGRRLTSDEAAKYRTIRQQIEHEKVEIARRLQSEAPGPGSWADLHELRSMVDSLRAERERRGLSRETVAQRAGIKSQQIEHLEEHRDLNPPLSTLTRYAAAVGRHLMMGLAAGEPLPAGPAITPAPMSTPTQAAHS
jgi:DNA-binding XRE family transcriptional regulator